MFPSLDYYLQERLSLYSLTPPDTLSIATSLATETFYQELAVGDDTVAVIVDGGVIKMKMCQDPDASNCVLMTDANTNTQIDIAAGGQVVAAAIGSLADSSKMFLALAVDAPVGWPAEANLPADRTGEAGEAALEAFMEKNL